MTVQNHFPAADGKTVSAGDGLTRKVGANSDNLMCVEVQFEKGAVAPLHSHPHEQITFVVSGKFEITVGEEIYTVSAGDSLYKQPNIVHGATCLEAGTLIDIFTPCRRDLL